MLKESPGHLEPLVTPYGFKLVPEDRIGIREKEEGNGCQQSGWQTLLVC
jgi:hypothetical protein